MTQRRRRRRYQLAIGEATAAEHGAMDCMENQDVAVAFNAPYYLTLAATPDAKCSPGPSYPRRLQLCPLSGNRRASRNDRYGAHC
jgi:hypothetical protein